jgi:hypothetical protein
MKKLAAILCLSALTTGAFAQGLVTFNNNPTTLVSSGPAGAGASINSGAGTYFFGLLISSTATGPFTFSGNYATNIASAGRLIGTPNLGGVVNGWAPGATMFFEVAGWSAGLGATWNNGWINADGSAKPANDGVWPIGNNFFGTSAIASGVAGGGPQSLPSQPIFGSAGVAGFNMTAVGGVPEPSTMALAGLGAAALLIFRRRK